MRKPDHLFLTDAQLKAELAKCEFCEEKPCKAACPSDCSPADFIMAARVGEPGDYERAAAVILGHNPLGGVCGAVCPDYHCMKACARRGFDAPVAIPAVQATLVQKAKDLGVQPSFVPKAPSGARVAVVGGGPAGLAAAAALAQLGHAVELFEREEALGGMARRIPAHRLPREVLSSDIGWIAGLGDLQFHMEHPVETPSDLLSEGFRAVVVTTGLDAPRTLGISNESAAVDGLAYLAHPGRTPVAGRRVLVVGGGAVAVDCAATAREHGAREVELVALESWAEMPLTALERQELLDRAVAVSGRTRVTELLLERGLLRGARLRRIRLPEGTAFDPRAVRDDPAAVPVTVPCDVVIRSIGARASMPRENRPGLFYAGDLSHGPSTVVEAAAAGKNAAAAVDAFLRGRPAPEVPDPRKSVELLAGRSLLPVPLDCDFFGRPIRSPFLLSAAPPTDGYEQMVKAYQAGWAGGVMKTAFDGLPIHIPGAYMFALTPSTYGNCDNVSGHPLDRVCDEIRRLVVEWPDRLTLASTGGPVTGDDAHDRAVWQSNTRKLEAAGAMGLEYSLSCPQGGDGTKGDIVSQDPDLTAKIIGWVMEVSDPEIPKLFKLTAAVTAIRPIMAAIREVFLQHPGKKAGITLANTFPSLAFRPGTKTSWEEGVVVGMSGEGVTPISNLTLAQVSNMGLVVSGNGGPMNYRAAADFLALGARTVQFCTIAMKHGVGIIDELHSGLSHLLKARGLPGVNRLIGMALPDPITGFMDLSPVKGISTVDPALCEHCGNCTRCPYLAITLNADRVPETDPARCVGCSICVQKCFAGALAMRARTSEEAAALREA